VLFERADGGLLGLHQHGWSHANHEPQGRKCEFGASRPRAAQHDDVRRGHDRLRALLGERLDPIFTPPWNRCTDSTAECLVELGLRVLSRDTTARPFGRADLAEVPVTLDWFKSYRPGMTVSDGCAAELSAQIERGSTAPIGIMTHHGVTDAANRQLIGELLDVLRTCPLVTCRRLIDTLTVRVMPR
jgi:peptidoglycan/xylan/chitin deacetylase (PgdA/CDA1 family)